MYAAWYGLIFSEEDCVGVEAATTEIAVNQTLP
jgi:hypothetical protein